MHQKFLQKIKAKIYIVGLPTTIFFAEQGFPVTGVARNEKNLKKINQCISTIGELNLDSRLKKVVDDKKLKAPSNLKKATQDSDIIISIVPFSGPIFCSPVL